MFLLKVITRKLRYRIFSELKIFQRVLALYLDMICSIILQNLYSYLIKKPVTDWYRKSTQYNDTLFDTKFQNLTYNLVQIK